MFIASVMPSSHLILWHPLLLLPSIFPSIKGFSNESSVGIKWPKAGASASILPVNIQCWSSLRLTGLISLLLRDFQESFPAPQFEGINSFAFCLLYRPALITVRGPWEDHSLDSTDLCRQSNVSAFQHTVQVCHRFPAKKQSSSDFMAAVTVCSDSGAQEKEISHYFHLFPFYLPCSNGAGCHDLSFLIFNLKLPICCPPSPSSRGSLVPLSFLPLEWYHPHIWGWCFSPHLDSSS